MSGMQPDDLCKLRNYIRNRMTESLETILKHKPSTRFGKQYVHRKYFIKKSHESVKSGFNSFLIHPTSVIPNKAKLTDYESTRCKLMYKHTDKMEMETITFLQSVSNARHAEFEANFFRESKKCIKDAYDVFVYEMRSAPKSKIDGKLISSKRAKVASKSVRKNDDSEKVVSKKDAQKDSNNGDQAVIKLNQAPRKPVTNTEKDTNQKSHATHSNTHSSQSHRKKNVNTVDASEKPTSSKRAEVTSKSARNNDDREKVVSKKDAQKPTSSKPTSSKRAEVTSKSARNNDDREKVVSKKDAQKHSNNGDQAISKLNQAPLRPATNTEKVPDQKSRATHSNTYSTQSHRKKNVSTVDTTHSAERGSSSNKQTKVVEEEPTDQSEGLNSAAVVTHSTSQQVETTQTDSTNKARPGDLVYHCFYCKNSNNFNARFDTEASVFNHWQMQHKEEQSNPFRFYAEETAVCYHCDFFGLWSTLVKHYYQTHYPTLPFAISNGNDRAKCAFCGQYTGQNLMEHIETKHKETLHNLSSKSLSSRNGFMQISAKNVKKLFPNGEHERTATMQFICDNDHLPISLAREDLLEHLQKHGINCPCRFKTKSLFDFLVHRRDVHGRNEFEYYQSDFEFWSKNAYHNMMALFENGLVLPNRNLKGTHLGHFHDFQCDIEEFLTTLKSEFEQQIATENSKEITNVQNNQTASQTQESDREQIDTVAGATKRTWISEHEIRPEQANQVTKNAQKDHGKHSNDGDQPMTESNQTPQQPVISASTEQVPETRIIRYNSQSPFQENQATHTNTRTSQSNPKMHRGESSDMLAIEHNYSDNELVVAQEGTSDQNEGPNGTVDVMNSIAPPIEITPTDPTNKDRPGDLVYHCYYCKDANQSNATFDNKESVFSHWQMQHKKEQSKWFRFYAEETALCCHCEFFGLWTDLIKHHHQTHQSLQFGITNGNDRAKCAFCEYRGKIPGHINKDHSGMFHTSKREILEKSNGFIQISVANLRKLVSPNGENGRVKFICETTHSPIEITKINVLKHLQEHGIDCICEYKTKSFSDLLTHMLHVHGYDDIEEDLIVFRNHLMDEFYNMKVLFRNGLVLSNKNLVDTNFRHFTDFHNDVKNFIATLKLEFQTEISMKYRFGIVICYVPGENVNMIFENLCQRLGIQINRNDIIKIERNESKRAIVVECRHAYTKQQIRTIAANKPIWISDLIHSFYAKVFGWTDVRVFLEY